jgi:3-oxoacyl-(acyl-carrier-protein) synthase
MPENIAITGLGAVSACGNNVLESLESFSSGRRNSKSAALFSPGLKFPVFEVDNVLNQDHTIMRTLNLAFQALKEAIEDAGLKDLKGYRVGVCLGTTVASQLNDIDFYRTYREKGSAPSEGAKRFLNSNLAQATADFLGIESKCCLTVVNACSSGTDAIGVGLSWLCNDYCDIVICGGADELNRVPLDGFAALGVVSSSLSLPFDRKRSGLNLGEGAGIVILEQESHACKRKKEADLFLKGYGAAVDGYHLTAPHPEGKGLEKALEAALSQAGINREEVSFVNAHGTATKDNDKVEGRVLKKVFGKDLKFLSTKGFTGHTLGAAGGLEAVFSALSLRAGWIPGSIGFNEEDDEIGISPVRQRTEIKGRYAVSTSLAFGGNNSALVISKG